jgi:DNA polymerase-3 subunit delta
VMVARQYRLMLQAKDLRERGVPQAEIATRLRVHNFVAQRVLQQASAYSIAQLRDAYRLMVEADLNIKRGVYNDETAMELLLFELSSARASGRQRQGPSRGRPGYSTPRAAPAQRR